MKRTAHGKPLLINDNNQTIVLNKLDLLDEASIQDLIYQNPECLPVSEIDESYNPLIPVCKELNTPVGPLDLLMVSPNGDLTIIETKLWRNPEARRKVVAQILDYAKELSNWTYEDLQREINKRTGRKGNTLYEIAKAYDSDKILSEPDFIDSVSRNMSRGRFLLLIVGDGIREGARGITEFLTNSAHLNFTFAQIELNVYKAEGYGTLIVPKTIVKTIEIPKLIVEIPTGFVISREFEISNTGINETVSSSPEWENEKNFYSKFWQELINEMIFDDPGQPLPKVSKTQNLYLFPGETKKVWVSAYFMKSQKRVGVYFRAQNDSEGNEILNNLEEYKDDIRNELGDEAIWNWEESGAIGVRKYCEDVFAEKNRHELKEFYKYWINAFVNAIRPRLRRNVND